MCNVPTMSMRMIPLEDQIEKGLTKLLKECLTKKSLTKKIAKQHRITAVSFSGKDSFIFNKQPFKFKIEYESNVSGVVNQHEWYLN